jgi:hypothetical protein
VPPGTMKIHKHTILVAIKWSIFGMIVTGENRSTGRRVQVSLCPPQISHWLMWVWTQAYVVRGRKKWGVVEISVVKG